MVSRLRTRACNSSLRRRKSGAGYARKVAKAEGVILPASALEEEAAADAKTAAAATSGAATISLSAPRKKPKEKERKIALIQLASQYSILLIQIQKMPHVPKELLKVLEDPKVLLAGVQISGDAKKARKDYGIEVKGV